MESTGFRFLIEFRMETPCSRRSSLFPTLTALAAAKLVLSHNEKIDAEWQGGAGPNFFSWRVPIISRGFGVAGLSESLASSRCILPCLILQQTRQLKHQELKCGKKLLTTQHFSSMLQRYLVLLQCACTLSYRYLVWEAGAWRQ
mmetsp:Transcript_29542/g.47551  ORF Transcript_29542/g.47551 Transcript_29542/m.47551 type:complete len:144 (-) Transcript_29542:193-624(-)